MTSVTNLTNKDFDNEVLKHGGLVILECINGNNGSSHIMQAVIANLKKSIPVNFTHFKIDLQKYPFIINRFYVLYDLSFLIFYDGRLIGRNDGLLSFSDFSEKLNKLLHIENLLS